MPRTLRAHASACLLRGASVAAASFGLLFSLRSAARGQAPSAPNTAIGAAVHFLRALERSDALRSPADSGASTSAPIGLSAEGEPDGRPAGWKVEFAGRNAPILILNPQLNSVRCFANMRLDALLQGLPAARVSRSVPLDVAERSALAALRLAGARTGDLGLQYASLVDTSLPATRATRIWVLYFARTWHGLPFFQGAGNGDGASVVVDAFGGLVVSFHLYQNLVLPVTPAIIISMERSIDIARRFTRLVNGVTSLAGPSVAQLYVVRPTDWAKNGRIRPASIQTRIAWVVVTPITRIGDQPGSITLYVAGDNGAIVGGSASGGAKGLTAGATVARATGGRDGSRLRQAVGITLSSLAGPRIVARFSEGTHPLRFYGLVSDLRHAGAGSPPFHPSWLLKAAGPAGASSTWFYDSGSGLLSTSRTGAAGLLCAGAGLMDTVHSLSTGITVVAK